MWGQRFGSVLAKDSVNVEIFWLDRQGLFQLQRVGWIVHNKVEALEDRDQSYLCFLPGESTTLGNQNKQGSR